ncbi:MAG: hypothetical protein ACTSQ5_15345, partial [Promethearchaeota archaeon]
MTTSTNIPSVNFLLDKLNSSGINISPKALLFLNNIGINAKQLEEIIQSLSFSPNFNSHITMKTIQRDFIEVFKNFEENNLNPKNLQSKDLVENVKLTQNKMKNDLKEHSSKNVKLRSKNVLFPISKIDMGDDKVLKSDNADSVDIEKIPELEAKPNEKVKNGQKINNKKGEWEPLKLRRSTSTFKAIASEYNAEIKILKDPTKNLYTEGKKRPEATGLLEINMINRLNNSVNVKFIGMVVNKRQTMKKKYLIEFEDPTGTCMSLVRQESKKCYDLIPKLLPDHVVIVDGYLNVNQDSNSKIVLINDIIFPDTPKEHQIKCPDEDLAICLISDTHFGSKDWLEKIWYRFIDYLNCRIGTDKQIKQAGKIKYLCITGDIVDGIGVYPNQDKRLLITD